MFDLRAAGFPKGWHTHPRGANGPRIFWTSYDSSILGPGCSRFMIHESGSMFGFCAGLAIHSLLHGTASAIHSSTRPRRWRTLAGVQTAKHTHAISIASTSTVGETRPPRGRERGSTQSASNSSKQAGSGPATAAEVTDAARCIPAQYPSLKKRMKDT